MYGTKGCIVIWMTLTLLAIVIIFAVDRPEIVGTNLCSLLSLNFDAVEHFALWLITCFVISVNLICLIILFRGYCILLTKIWGLLFGKAAKSSTRTKSYSGIIKIVILMVGSLVTWIPITCMYIFTLCGYQMNLNIEMWIFIISTPINSCLNPIVLTLSIVCAQLNVKLHEKVVKMQVWFESNVTVMLCGCAPRHQQDFLLDL